VREAKYVPKHRNAPPEPALKKSLRRTLSYSGVAVAATGIAVTGGVVMKESAPADPAAATIAAAQAERSDRPLDPALADRGEAVSRSDRRTAEDKREALDQASGGQVNRTQVTRTADLAEEDPRDVARRLMPEYGLPESEFECLDALWVSESDWDPTADNPTSTAYGIPQALTGGTHDNLPADYMTNPVSQIRWGLWYIKNSYGSACSAWSFKQANNWY
jgi:hypothetical protein